MNGPNHYELGVSCDSCLKGNFRGRRYKCLVCYDYDLCSTCYEAGATGTRHTAEHPVQCILTRSDFDLYYGGEAVAAEQAQSFTCPCCGKMGYTESTLQEHLTAEHNDPYPQIVCPICAALPGGDPNHVTDDFSGHLTLEHRTPRDFDEPSSIRHVRRIHHPGRGVGGTRTRRANMHFSSGGGSTLTGLSPSGRETMDPIAELLSQLSSVRSRAAAAQSVSSQLQQLEMQLQSTRQQLERLPRRQTEAAKAVVTSLPPSSTDNNSNSGTKNNNVNTNSQYLLSRNGDDSTSESEKQNVETDSIDRSLFVQDLLLSTFMEQLELSGDMDRIVSESEHLSLHDDDDTQSEKSMQISSESSTVTEQRTDMKQMKSTQATLEKPPPMVMRPTSAGSSGALVRQGQNSIPRSLHSVQVGSGPQGSLSHGIGAGAVNMNSSQAHGRPSSATLNPAAAKKTLLNKPFPPSKTTDREPPPH